MAYSNLVALSHADWSLFLLIVALRRRPNISGFVTTHDKDFTFTFSLFGQIQQKCQVFAGMLLWKLKFYNGDPVSHLAPGRLFRSVGFNFLQLSGLGEDKITKVESQNIFPEM